jgi:hypothetical protein
MAYSNFYARFYAICQQIGEALVALWHFMPSRWYLLFIAFFQVAAWLQAWSIRHNLTGDLLVLHYNVNFGTDLVGPPNKILIYPLFGLGVFLANLVFLIFLRQHKNWRSFVHLLLGAAVIFGLFLCLALLSIYLINFR